MRILIIGNCQASALCGELKRAYRHERDITFDVVAAYKPGAFKNIDIRSYSLTIGQIGEFEDENITAVREESQAFVPIPAYMMFALWPHNSEPHIHNEVHEHFSAGPYPLQSGNRWLNQRLLEGGDPKRIVDDYESLNLASEIKIERLLKMNKRRFDRIDAACGLSGSWDLVEKRMKEHRVFHAPLHPENVFIQHVFQHVESIIGRSDRIQPIFQNQQLYRRNQPPIHPSLGPALGLDWVSSDTLYNFWDEGGFTHYERTVRYLQYQVDFELAAALNSKLESESAAQILEAKADDYPLSIPLRLWLGKSAMERKDLAAARKWASAAYDLDPDDAENNYLMSKVVTLEDDEDASIHYLERGREIEETHFPTVFRLGSLRARQGQPEVALAHFLDAADLRPRMVEPRVQAAKMYVKLGQLAQARRMYGEILRFDPQNEAVRAALGRL